MSAIWHVSSPPKPNAAEPEPAGASLPTQPEPSFVIDFGRPGNSAEFLGWGWSSTEEIQTWTVGRSSRLYLPPPTSPGTYAMVLEATPFLWGERSGQRLKVFANGQEVGDFVISEPAIVEVEIPWPAISGRSSLSITFEHPDSARPRQASGVADDRELALAFERISLVRLSEPGRPLIDGSARPELPLRDLMTQFESLGQNCEFGLVQRQCGAEPLGLLRFASTPLPSLFAALRARFSGFAEPGQLEIQAAKGEYLVIDKRFDLLYHAWVNVGEAPPEDVLAREQRRLPLLRRKLIEDLEEGGKIFVYHGMQPLHRAAMLSLLTAIRGYGPATLLWVELADQTHPSGHVEEIAAGLLKGYMDRFAPGENAHDLSLESWIALCRNAYAATQRA